MTFPETQRDAAQEEAAQQPAGRAERTAARTAATAAPHASNPAIRTASRTITAHATQIHPSFHITIDEQRSSAAEAECTAQRREDDDGSGHSGSDGKESG
jgi:hypothetical protein